MVLEFSKAGEASSLNVSINRSGIVRVAPSINEASIQTDPVNVERVRLRVNQRICTDEVKNTCAILSSKCGISAETARKVVQIVYKMMYGHDVYLSAKESGGKDLTYVLPSSRTISDHKQYLAMAAARKVVNKRQIKNIKLHIVTDIKSRRFHNIIDI